MEKAELIEPFSDTYNEHAQIRKIPIEALKKHSNVEYAHINGTPLHLQIITPQTRILSYAELCRWSVISVKMFHCRRY